MWKMRQDLVDTEFHMISSICLLTGKVKQTMCTASLFANQTRHRMSSRTPLFMPPRGVTSFLT